MSMKIKMTSYRVCDCCEQEIGADNPYLHMPCNPRSEVDLAPDYCVECIKRGIELLKREEAAKT